MTKEQDPLVEGTDPDPYQNDTGLEHWQQPLENSIKQWLFFYA